jgi:hypothetical protein
MNKKANKYTPSHNIDSYSLQAILWLGVHLFAFLFITFYIMTRCIFICFLIHYIANKCTPSHNIACNE